MSHLLSIKDLTESIKMPELELADEAEVREDLQKEVNALRTTLQVKEEAMSQLMSKKMSLQKSPIKRRVPMHQDNAMWQTDLRVTKPHIYFFFC